MKYFYISSMEGRSGICKYSQDFYELILKDKGYIFIESEKSIPSILSLVSSRDYVHIELGIFQEKELAITMRMLDAGYKNIAVTLHDPPIFKYPFHAFRNTFLDKISRFYDLYINKFRNSEKYMHKIKVVYVLSQRGLMAVKSRYKIEHVYYMPHVINQNVANRISTPNKNFIYLGFIGRNKGIEYSLQLHAQLLHKYPEIKFYVVGTALGKEKEYYNFLKAKYTRNVYFLDYVEEGSLAELFKQVRFSFILFKEYNFFHPVSGSVLYNLKMGSILFTNKANAITEIVEDKKNGFFLSYNIKKDIDIVSGVLEDTDLQESVSAFSRQYLLQNHSPAAVRKSLLSL